MLEKPSFYYYYCLPRNTTQESAQKSADCTSVFPSGFGALEHAHEKPELQNLEVSVFYFPEVDANVNPRSGIALGTSLDFI